MAVKYAKIQAEKYRCSWWHGGCKEWRPNQIERVVKRIVASIEDYKGAENVQTDYTIGYGGRIVETMIKSDDDLIEGFILYDPDEYALTVEIDFKAEGEEHREDYLDLERIVRRL